MGGSSRRQRSTSASRRRGERRRQCSAADGIEEEETTTIHGLSSIFIWILATSSLVVVITPSANNHILPTSNDAITAVDKLILDSTSSKFKMDAPNDNQMFFPFRRQQGLRYRDDESMYRFLAEQASSEQQYTVNPILTEQPPHVFGMGASTSNHHATTSDFSEPGLMDAELIDILWRDDISVEKGTQQIPLAEQYESDLQTLTEKSLEHVLTQEEQARFEGYSRNYYQDFYTNSHFYHKSNQQPNKMATPEHQTPESGYGSSVPTDEDLDELLKDFSDEEGQLNKYIHDQKTVENDASLTDALVYTPANLTEMQEMQESCNQVNITASSVVSSSQSATLFNDTDAQTREQWEPSEVTPSDVFPAPNYVYIPPQNNSAQSVISNGQVSYDHSYSAQSPLAPLNIGSTSNGRQQQTQTSPGSVTVTATATQSLFDSYHLSRHSFSDCTTDSSSPCSRLSSESPRYNSESSTHESRFYGKLVPSRESRFERSRSPLTKIGRVIPPNGQRKRGRQSKDEQLANEHSLPVTAHQISEMSLSELQQVLKSESLSEYQRQLIRKIRRRGKNKVAARTCRQRRTDRHDSRVMNLYQ